MTKPLDPIRDNHNEELDDIVEDEATKQESESPDDPELEKRKIFTHMADPPIHALYIRYEARDLVLDPHFQRRKVWDDSRSSKLIESLILGVPLPIFYLAEGADGKEEVIDGQQRLSAFFRFLRNDYSLKGLKALKHLNEKYFKDLDRPTQKLVRDSSIRTITFQKESDENLRFEIFERLNTGAVPLNRQELRNCIYRGPYNELLISLAADPDYMWLMGLKSPEKRMKDVEYVLRFAAFHHATYLNYKPPIARFLDEDMRKFRYASEGEQKELRSAFKTAVTLVRSLLGQHAFHRFYSGTEKAPGGRWETKQFNASLYDILMGSLAGKDRNQVMANLDVIREALIVIMTEDESFIEAIEKSTSSVNMVKTRFDKWRRTLDDILDKSPEQPRTFSRELKQALYDVNSTCQLCGNAINDLDDAALDHIEQYWLGGKTIPENARLTHRHCNWSRRRKEPEASKNGMSKDDRRRDKIEMSALDAAAKVLGEAGKPMNCRDLIEAMAAKAYWTSPTGKTPVATVFKAMTNEIRDKGTLSRFVKADRGLFGLASAGQKSVAPDNAGSLTEPDKFTGDDDEARAISKCIEPNCLIEQEGEHNRPKRYGLRKRFWQELLRRPKVKNTRHANIAASEYSWIAAGSGVGGLPFTYAIGQDEGRVELWINRGTGKVAVNKEIFEGIYEHKAEIEEAFDGELSWQRLDDKQGCRIAYITKGGGYRSDPSKWPEIQDAMIDAMIRLEKALIPHLAKLKTELASEGA